MLINVFRTGEQLTLRVRRDTFAAILRQEMGWFDEKANSTGALCARLSSDSSKIQGATGSRMGTLSQGFFTLLIAVVLSIYYSWKMGLVASLFIPVLLIGIILQQKIMTGEDSIEKAAFEKSAQLAVEAITNIRTVVGIQCEDIITEKFTGSLDSKSNTQLSSFIIS